MRWASAAPCSRSLPPSSKRTHGGPNSRAWLCALPAGEGLCRTFVQEGKAESAALLCQEISSRAPRATWALKRLGEWGPQCVFGWVRGWSGWVVRRVTGSRGVLAGRSQCELAQAEYAVAASSGNPSL